MKDATIYARFVCIDCTTNTHDIDEYYMVTDEIWAEIGMECSGGMLCIGCVEDRLKRPLTGTDFSDYPINTAPFLTRSKRLQNRLTANASPEAIAA